MISKPNHLLLVVSKLHGLRILKSFVGCEWAQVMVLTVDDRGKGQSSRYMEIVDLCNEGAIQCLTGAGEALTSVTRTYQPEVVVVAGWYWMIPPQVLRIPRLGFLGIHHSLLPKFRGGAPLVWSLLAGERIVGSSLFVMTEGLDDGPILHQWRETVYAEDTSTTILDRLTSAIGQDIQYLIHSYVRGRLKPTRQDHQKASFAPIRKYEDSQIDWTLRALDLHRYARALQSPYPELFFTREDSTLRIKSIEKAGHACFGKPGTVLEVSGANYLIKCGLEEEGVWITLDEASSEVLKRWPIKRGERLSGH